jgi:outer membrane lipoprotein-sorting protein
MAGLLMGQAKRGFTAFPVAWAGLALAALLWALPASADRATDILQAAVQAEQSVSYQATVELRVMQGTRVGSRQTMKVASAPGNRHRVEIVGPAPEAGRLIVRDGRTEWEYWPRNGRVVERQLPSAQDVWRQKLGALGKAQADLHAAYVGLGTVAGRKCHVVSVSPPDGKRVRKQVWVDAGTYVELKWERYGGDGRPTATWAVQRIAYGAAPASLFSFRPPTQSRVVKVPRAPEMPLAEAERAVGMLAVIPQAMPRGFALDRRRVGVVRFGRTPALWLRFSNGVDSLSLFQSVRLGKTPDRMRQALRWDTGNRTFLLVGRVSPQESQKIKASTSN